MSLADHEYFITLLEGRLQAAVRLQRLEELTTPTDLSPSEQPADWQLAIRLVYDGIAVGTTAFTLHQHNADEARDVARNIGSNPYLMREIDEFLWGESD